ncbi:MAG: NUDIX domain-containing protein [Ornithinimicrobium sp.]|uniref:NUDIX domain-containing protein n=1 Tax=Ornithinimicrobium sp. TaxID=1977084 RepID=UPI0026E05433|nr:NUDIX domain-containing protein [Ornithinimicrobium sp.]MDO5738562.1 NUDIX domain-containing protein [Ornithinimicrobium sp.]
MHRVRPATRGLVIAGDQILVTVLTGTTGEYWLTPGGGQDFGEAKVDNVAREVYEETGFRVTVGDLACGRDYIGATHFPAWDSGFHQTELFFWCTLQQDSRQDPVPLPDTAQTDIRWVRVPELIGSPLYPRRLAAWLNEDSRTRPLWLGDVN